MKKRFRYSFIHLPEPSPQKKDFSQFSGPATGYFL